METTIVRTAGMVNGTPDWQLDRMYEDEAARAWEWLNEQPKDAFDLVEPEKLLDVYAHLDTVKDINIDHALEWIDETMELLKGTPEHDKLAMLHDALSDIGYDLMQIANKAHEYWRKRA